MFLNNLHVMLSKGYDGEGTANFVGIELVRSLGITRKDVANIFHHAIYDGVYATPDERAHGVDVFPLHVTWPTGAMLMKTTSQAVGTWVIFFNLCMVTCSWLMIMLWP